MAVEVGSKPVPARHRVPTVETPRRRQAKVYGSVTLALRPQDCLNEHEIQDAGRRVRDVADELDREFRFASRSNKAPERQNAAS